MKWYCICEGCVGEWTDGWSEECTAWLADKSMEMWWYEDNLDHLSPNNFIHASLCKWKALTYRWKAEISLDFVVKLCKIPTSTDVWSDLKRTENCIWTLLMWFLHNSNYKSIYLSWCSMAFLKLISEYTRFTIKVSQWSKASVFQSECV